MALFLAFKEIWRNRARFFLFSLVIALITTLVLFIAALSEGLATANKQYLENLDAELIIFQKNVDLSTTASRIERSRINDIQRVPGVSSVGSIGFSNAKVLLPGSSETINVSIIGVEAGKPGTPNVIAGNNLLVNRGSEVIIDLNVVNQTGLGVGDRITLRTLQGTREETFTLTITGIAPKLQYLYSPSIFIPYLTWDQIRSQAPSTRGLVELTSNIVAVKVSDPAQVEPIRQAILQSVADIEVADIKTAYESIPGYQAQQNTLNTQRGFTLLIGILVIGGFFQIQMLQKIPQIGVLKAIGASNLVVALAVVFQIIIVTTFGVALGTAVALGLGAAIPGNVPVIFDGNSVAIAIVTLLAIGPVGGLVSVRLAVRAEPLLALGLSS